MKSVARAIELGKLLVAWNFPSISIHSGLAQEERSALLSSYLWADRLMFRLVSLGIPLSRLSKSVFLLLPISLVVVSISNELTSL